MTRKARFTQAGKCCCLCGRLIIIGDLVNRIPVHYSHRRQWCHARCLIDDRRARQQSHHIPTGAPA